MQVSSVTLFRHYLREIDGMAKTQTRPWDPAAHLNTEEDIAAYLAVAEAEGDPNLIAAAREDVARARRMARPDDTASPE